MLFTQSLPPTPQTYIEMRNVCSDWEKAAAAKITENSIKDNRLFQRYVSAKSVSTYSFYRLKKHNPSDYHIDIIYDSDLTLHAFALSKIITITTSTESKSQKFLFLHYMTSNPHQFEAKNRIQNIGGAIFEALKKRCNDERLDGIFSEPVLSAFPYFYRHGFCDTELRRKVSAGRTVPRKALIYQPQT